MPLFIILEASTTDTDTLYELNLAWELFISTTSRGTMLLLLRKAHISSVQSRLLHLDTKSHV